MNLETQVREAAGRLHTATPVDAEDGLSRLHRARRTCANLAVSAFRRRVSEVKALVRLGHPVDRPALTAEDEALWSAVRALPKRQAQAAALRYLYDLSVTEIANTLDISVGSVKQHLSRARSALSAQLHLDPGQDSEQASGLDLEGER